MELDAAAKVILDIDPDPVLELVFGPGAHVTGSEETEVPAITPRLDKLLELALPGRLDPCWVCVEVAASWRADVPERAHEYWTLARRRRSPLESVVLVLKPGDRQGRPLGRFVVRSELDGDPILDFRLRVLAVWELDVEAILASARTGLLPLVPYAGGADEAAVKRAAEQIAREPDDRRRADLFAALQIFATNVFPEVQWTQTISEEKLMGSELWQRAEAKGRAEGRVEGRAEALVEALVRLLHKRLGADAEPYLARLERCDEPTAVRVLELIGDAPDASRLRAGLDALLPS